MKLVSAVITTHNRLKLLQRAIASVQEQTYGNIELIVVDDASEDGTKEYGEQQQSFLFIHIPKEESRGGNHARNVGVLAAHGEYVAFLDDDDYWLPTKIEKQVALIENGECEMVHCGRREEIITKNGVQYRDKLPKPIHYGDCSRKVLLNITTTTTNMLVRRQALLDVGLFDENLRFWQEYEMLIRLAQRRPFDCVHEPLSVYRVDVKDKARLTNKYFEWKGAVSYIHEKHRNLYEQLTARERFGVKVLVWKDGAKRCKTSGLYIRFFFLASFYVLGSGVMKVWGKFDHNEAMSLMQNNVDALSASQHAAGSDSVSADTSVADALTSAPFISSVVGDMSFKCIENDPTCAHEGGYHDLT